MSKTIIASTGHTMSINKVDFPSFINEEDYALCRAVQNWDKDGHTFFYIASGYNKAGKKGEKEIHVFYPNGKMWSSFGSTQKKAIDGAIKDGWLYTK